MPFPGADVFPADALSPGGAVSEGLQFDPTSEDAANSPLSVMDASYNVLAHSYPAPPLNVLYASSIDTEGEIPASRRYSNRQISMTLEMVDPTGDLLSALEAKVAKIAREGGTLKRTMPNGDVIVFDLVSAEQFDPSFDLAYVIGNMVQVDLVFGAKPFGRGAEVTLSAHNETSLPCLVFTETAITGDAPALGRLTITEAQAVNQAWAVWGLQSLYYSSSANAALFYQAESRTPLGAAATAAGPSGASGSGSNVVRHQALVSSYQGLLSTQASGGGAHLSHVGDFAVFARVQTPATNTGAVSVALEWGQGDFRAFTRNAPASVPSAAQGGWLILDLGQVHIEQVVAGTQRWEGRVVAKSTVVGDDIDIDTLMLVPVTEGSGRVSLASVAATPTTFVAQSFFATESGAITGDSLATGGTWGGAGDADDFSVSGGVATRTATSDTATFVTGGRLITTSGSSAMTSTTVTAAFQMTTLAARFGVIARYTDINNFLAVVFDPSNERIALNKWVAGTRTEIGAREAYTTLDAELIAGKLYLSLTVLSPGTFAVSSGTSPEALIEWFTGSDAALATGGTLASGKVGLVDYNPTATASTRSVTAFQAWAPPEDAAMFASQSLEIRHNRVVREDSGGTLWVTPSIYEGDYLLIPPAGAENRTNRFFVKASRGLPGEGPDSGIDDISATLSYTPRFLVVP